MRSNLVRRCAALALLVALVAPRVWALPRGGAGRWWWEVWEWLTAAAAKHGLCIDPEGSPYAPVTAPEPPPGPDTLKHGLCINPDGTPSCAPSGGPPTATSGGGSGGE